MSHEYLHISTDNGKTWRDLKDTAQTAEYINKLSHAAIVRVKYDTGEWHEIECGQIINRGGMYQNGASVPQRTQQEPNAKVNMQLSPKPHVEREAAKFPATFGLRAFPGQVFRISLASSFVSEGQVILYTEVKRPDGWVSFCKGTTAELLRNIVKL